MDVKDPDDFSKHSNDDNQSAPTHKKLLKCPRWRKAVLYTLTLYLASFMYGWIVAIKGPSLLDLEEITHVNTASSASFFTSASVGSVLGALVGGAFYDRFNKQLVLFASVLLCSVTCALIPFCTSFWLMVAMFFLHEFMIGGFKTGSNVEIFNLWGEQSKQYMQGLHFFFSLGASISPLVLQPFLSKDIPSTNSTSSFQQTLNLSQSEDEELFDSSFNSTSGFGVRSIHTAYILSGGMGVIAACGLLVRFFLDKNHEEQAVKPKTQPKTHSAYPKCILFSIFILFFLLYFFLDEVEDSSPAFLATFVVRGLNWSKTDGLRVTSAFWASFTAGRLLGAISVSFFSHFKFFIVCSCCLVLAQTGLLISGIYRATFGIWISVAMAGISISVVLPASLTWMEKEFVLVSGKIVSVVYVALSFGGMVNPQLIGYLMQHVTYLGYCYILLAETVMFVLTLAALKIFQEKVLKKYQRYHVTSRQEEDSDIGKHEIEENVDDHK